MRRRSISTGASVSVLKTSALSSSSRSLLLKNLTSPFSYGLPGSMNAVVTPPLIQLQTARDVPPRSGPPEVGLRYEHGRTYTKTRLT